MKPFFYSILLIISITSCGSSCNKDKTKWEEVFFEFEIPLNISPGADTINVGDELTFSASFPDSLFDHLCLCWYVAKTNTPRLRLIDQPHKIYAQEGIKLMV